MSASYKTTWNSMSTQGGSKYAGSVSSTGVWIILTAWRSRARAGSWGQDVYWAPAWHTPATQTLGLLLAWAVAVWTQGKYRAAEDEAPPHKTGGPRNALCTYMNLVSLENLSGLIQRWEEIIKWIWKRYFEKYSSEIIETYVCVGFV